MIEMYTLCMDLMGRGWCCAALGGSLQLVQNRRNEYRFRALTHQLSHSFMHDVTAMRWQPIQGIGERKSDLLVFILLA